MQLELLEELVQQVLQDQRVQLELPALPVPRELWDQRELQALLEELELPVLQDQRVQREEQAQLAV